MTRFGLGCLQEPVEWSNGLTLFESQRQYVELASASRSRHPQQAAHGSLRGACEQERSFRRYAAFSGQPR